jgi:Tfp pilus assembly protein PilX
MNSLIIRLKNEEGNLTIIAFVLLVVLTLVGIFATRTAQIDLLTAYNEVPYKQNFYVAEGGVNREATELGKGSPSNVGINNAPRDLLGKSYKVSVNYLGAFVAPKGFSAVHFSRYDYDVEAKTDLTGTSGQVRVAARVYKVGPKAE